MKTRMWMACLACIMVGFALSGLAQTRSNGQDKADNLGRVKWKYRVIHVADVNSLDEIGS